MIEIDRSTIQTLANDLATNTFHRYVPSQKERRLDASFRTDFARALTPAVALFIGRLMVLAPDQESEIERIVRTFFDDPEAIDALVRYAAGEANTAGDQLEAELYLSGLRPTYMTRSYLDENWRTLIVAAGISAERRSLDARFRSAMRGDPLWPLLHPAVEFPYMAGEVAEYLDRYEAAGIGHVELGRAVAADGIRELYAWRPLATAGPPPEEIPAEVGNGGGEGPESLGELPAETTGSEESPVEGVPPPPPPAPPPPPLEPQNGGDAVVALRLDAALPNHVVVSRSFDLAVAIRREGSPPLAPDDLERRESADFDVVWPEDAAAVQLRIQVSAPECEIHGGDTRPVRLLAGKDSPPVYFQLTPEKSGTISVIITVYQDVDWVGSTRLRTEAQDEAPRGTIAISVESRPLGSPEVNQLTLFRAVDEGYSLSEMETLCFELGIDYADVPGETKEARARELVLYASRRNLTAALVEKVMKDRPHLLVMA